MIEGVKSAEKDLNIAVVTILILIYNNSLMIFSMFQTSFLELIVLLSKILMMKKDSEPQE